MSHRPEIDSILKQVEGWPAEEKRALALQLLRTKSVEQQAKRPSLGNLIGIANPTGRLITDEELDEVRYQALKEKYGL